MWDEITYFFANILTVLKTFGLWMLDLSLGVFKSVLYWIFDKLCDLVEWFVGLIDFKNELFDTTLAWGNIPSELIYVLNEVGLDNGFVIIGAALIIRLTLNLIPAALTRV